MRARHSKGGLSSSLNHNVKIDRATTQSVLLPIFTMQNNIMQKSVFVRRAETRVDSLFSYTTEERYVHIFDFGERSKGKRSYFMLNYAAERYYVDRIHFR